MITGPDEMTSIVAVRWGGLGDLLVILPSLRLIRAAFPEARITLVARIAYSRIFLAAGVVDVIEDAENFQWAALVDAGVKANPRDFPLPEADIVLGWFHSKAGADFQAQASTVWPKAITRSFVADPSAGRPLNQSFFDLTTKFAEDLNRPTAAFWECARLPLPPHIPAGQRRQSGLETPAGRFAVVHPGGGGRRKLWPVDRFLEIVGFLAGRGLAGVIVTGEAENHLDAELTGLTLPPGWIRWDRPPLFDLAALLAGSAFYLGNDSGVTHLAAVMGIPGLAVFRSEFADAWRPGGRITVVSSGDIRDLTPAAVLAELADFSFEESGPSPLSGLK
jgi:heptosyltransferase-3